MIKCCGRCNCKIIPFVPVPLRVNPIQCKRHDRQYICPDRTVRPGCINLTGCHIFDVIPISHIVIFCRGVPRRTIMYYDKLRNHHTAEHNFAGFCHWFDLVLRNFRRVFSIQCVRRNHKHFPRFLHICSWTHFYILNGRHICQDFCPGNTDRLKPFRLYI